MSLCEKAKLKIKKCFKKTLPKKRFVVVVENLCSLSVIRTLSLKRHAETHVQKHLWIQTTHQREIYVLRGRLIKEGY